MTKKKWLRLSWAPVLLFLLIGGLTAGNEEGCTDEPTSPNDKSCNLAAGVATQAECQQIASDAGCSSFTYSSTLRRCDGSGCPDEACPGN